MPSAISSPIDPVPIASIGSISLSPSLRTVPLPKALSICLRAKSRLFFLFSLFFGYANAGILS